MDQQADLELLPEKDYNHFDQMTTAELAKAAKSAKISVDRPRGDVLEELLIKTNEETGALYAKGILEILNDGWGFLRRENYVPSNQDVYVSQSQIKRFGLRPGDTVFAKCASPKRARSTRACCAWRASMALAPPRPRCSDAATSTS
jgi:transcription termination factor Rho